MIEFTSKQEAAMRRRDCRHWTELVADAWYNSAVPGALDYPASEIVAQLRAVYFDCQAFGFEDIGDLSRLAFTVLRAKTLGCDDETVLAISRYFVKHAKGDNVDYAQNWIDHYFEGN